MRGVQSNKHLIERENHQKQGLDLGCPNLMRVFDWLWLTGWLALVGWMVGCGWQAGWRWLVGWLAWPIVTFKS